MRCDSCTPIKIFQISNQTSKDGLYVSTLINSILVLNQTFFCLFETHSFVEECRVNPNSYLYNIYLNVLNLLFMAEKYGIRVLTRLFQY